MPRKGRFISLAERIAPFLGEPDACWVLPNRPAPTGYVTISVNGKGTRAHRAIYEFMVGPIPDGLELDHLCRNRSCVNPRHVEPVTHLENMRRAPAYDRRPYSKKGKRTACWRGHEYVDGSFRVTQRIDRRGNRYRERTCLICERDKKARQHEAAVLAGLIHPRNAETCRRGHPRTEENVGWVTDRRGHRSRFCRVCRRERDLQDYYRRKERNAA